MNSLLHDITAGAESSRRLVSLRWKSIRHPGTRWAILGAAGFFIFGLVICANLGYVVQVTAQEPGTAAGIFARAWITFLNANIMGLLGTAAVGSAVFVAIFGPFTGSATLSLASPEDLQSLRPAQSHRYFDSLLLNLISGLGLLQLLTLTAVASLLTLDGQRAPGMLFTWAVWVNLMSLMTLIGWSLEWVARRYGKRTRWVIGVVAMAILGAIVAVDPDHGTTLFGAARYYTLAARAGVRGWNDSALLIIAATVSTALLLMLAGLQAQRRALRLPPPAATFARARRYRDMGQSSFSIALSLLSRLLWRTPEVRRPMLSVVLIGLPAMFFIAVDDQIELSATLAIPLVISLAWGINSFALYGPGMPWIASNPRLMRSLPVAAMILQFVTSVSAVVVFAWLAHLAGNAPIATSVRVSVFGATSSLVATAVSINIAIARPVRARLSGRGDAIVPPATALAYMLTMILLAGSPVFTLMAMPHDWTTRLVFIGSVSAVAIVAIAYALFQWSRPLTRSRVAQVVGAD